MAIRSGLEVNSLQVHEITWSQILAVLASVSNFEVSIEGQHKEAAADSLAQRQPQTHRAFVSLAAEFVGNAYNEAELRNGLGQFSPNYVDRVLAENRFSIFNPDGKAIVSGNGRMPVISQESVDNLRNILSTPGSAEYATSVVGVMLAAYLHATRNAGGNRTWTTGIGAFDRLVSYYSPRIAYVQITMVEEPQELAERAAQYDARIAELEIGLEEREKQANRISEVIGSLQVRNETNAKYGDKFVAQLAGIQDDIAAWKKAIDEQIKLTAAGALWGERTKQGALAFYISGAILVAVMTGIPLIAYLGRDDIFQYLLALESEMVAASTGDNSIATTITAVGRLALISAPLAFVVWLIRLIVRYNMRSMLLMDDAQQRVTMLNTYLYLIEQDAASKADRGAILEALFRRAPGHGPDTVEPPNFTDLLKYGHEPQKP